MSLAHRQEVLDAHMNHSNWKKMVRIVPALLKHWKWLQPGLERSAEAFLDLSKHFKEQIKTWLAEDKATQRTRHKNPDAMDIYDTSKTEAPTRSTIQQQLISEEFDENAIHGETSWIAYGLKIQEMQLAIRYDVRSFGQQATIEEAQVIENKRSRLQSLINMFEHQADAYILNHHILGNAPISSLTDYSQFDHVDILDDSELEMFLGTSLRVLDHSRHSSDDSITHSKHLSVET
ncbi:hypothetical protein V8E53_004024 [Lactarius tabidus]